MSLLTIKVQNDDVLDTVVSGVNIYLYTTTAIFVTSGVTNSLGIMTLDIPIDTYDLLFFKQGVTFTQPMRIIMTGPTDNFLVTCHVRTMPESLDPSLCKVSGYVVDNTGNKIKDVYVRFNPIYENIVLNGNEVLNNPQSFNCDKRGYFEFDLIRTLRYQVYIDGHPWTLICRVPDMPSINLFDLIFPLPVSIDISTNSISLPLSGGQDASITYAVNYSDNNTGPLFCNWHGSWWGYDSWDSDWWRYSQVLPLWWNHDGIHVGWSLIDIANSNPEVATFSSNLTNFIINPLSIGTTTITFTRVINPHYVWINGPQFVTNSLTINVT